MTPTLVVLRPEPGNAATLGRAEAAGFAAIALPLFAVRALAWEVPDPTAYDALIVTSANTLRFGGAGLARLAALPVLAVGEHSAQAAIAAGFDVVATGEGTAAQLVELARARGIARALHLTGRDHMLAADGPIARVVAVYESAPLPVDATALQSLAGKVALLHSARAARRLAVLLDEAGVARADVAIAAFSAAIAAAAGEGWAAIAIAATPDDAALFDAIRILPETSAIDRPLPAPDKAVMDETAPDVPDAVLPAVDSVAPERPAPRALPPFTPPPPPPPASGLGWRMGLALVLLAFLVGVGLAAFVLISFKGMPTKPVATVTLPVGANGQPPVVIVPSKTAAAVPSIDLAALSSRAAELTARIADLEAREAAIDRDSQRASGYATRSEGLLVAFAARRALDRGLGLDFLEAQLRDRFGAIQPAAVATIVQAARAPVTLEDLRAGLDGVAPELMTGAASNGWWQSLQDEVGHLVVLRKAGTPSPLPADRVARARRLIEAGQVEAALAEVSRTPGVASAENWTSAARRYIDARHALAAIENAAILAPGVDATPPAATAVPAAAPAR